MSNRSWFFASNGQQQGPFPEAQFRDMIARRQITAETLVWSEGMSGWQKASDVPGLMARNVAPPAMPSAPIAGPAAAYVGNDRGVAQTAYGAGALSIDFSILEFTWRSLAFLFGSVLVIPIPWLLCWYVKWLTSCVQVPGRPNLSFTGSAGKIALYFFIGFAILVILNVIGAVVGSQTISNLGGFVQVVLYWLFLRYFIANLASNGQPLGLSFSGSFWGYLGWNLLMLLSFITIVGWAWVVAALVRWICKHIEGTRREVVYKGTGLEMLWRALVTAVACLFIIPIPWAYRWFLQWQISQTELVERGYANT